MEYPPPKFLIVAAWLSGRISTDEMIWLMEMRMRKYCADVAAREVGVPVQGVRERGV